MTLLTLDDFRPYFMALNTWAPYPWQAVLVKDIYERGRWPDVVDIPTGCGKSALMDIALFALALQAPLPRRIVITEHNRTVVDQLYDRAREIAHGLRNAEEGDVLHRVAQELRALSGREVALEVAQMRGAIPWDAQWLVDPTVPTIICGTVAQVGSCLLGRGYRVSRGMRPIYMGLLGNDCVHIVDGQATAYLQTLKAITRLRRLSDFGEDPDHWAVVETTDSGHGTTLTAADHKLRRIRDRIEPRKPAKLVGVKVRGAAHERSATFAGSIADEVLAYIQDGTHHAHRVGVFVNQVDLALRVGTTLQARTGDDDLDVVVITGRMRGLERDRIEDMILRSLGPSPVGPANPLVVVTTQALETADLCFDAIVTECAPLDALRRRFGRVNRHRLPKSPRNKGTFPRQTGTVIMRLDIGASEKKAAWEHPLYGAATCETWEHLICWENGLDGKFDFGFKHMRELLRDIKPENLAKLNTPTRKAPLLLPQHLDILAQTSEENHGDPDVSLWLHGIGSTSEDVQIVWRADLDPEELAKSAKRGKLSGDDRSYFRACPPSGLETVTVPICAVRAWLGNRQTLPVYDVVSHPEILPARGPRVSRPVLLWRDGDVSVAYPSQLRPGDVAVLPAAYGGLTDGNWDPRPISEPVRDIGDEVSLRPRLRLHPQVLADHFLPPFDYGVSNIRTWLNSAVDRASWLRTLIAQNKKRPLWPHASGKHIVLFGRYTGVHNRGDGASFVGTEVPLDSHLAGVGEQAWAFALLLGLPESVARDFELAGMAHDMGKADPRIQRWFRGDGFRAHGAKPLAKSMIDSALRWHRRAAAGYPEGIRHELTSLALLEGAKELEERCADWDLVLHLVASHHGHCRPFAPPVEDPEPILLAGCVDGVEVAGGTAHGYEKPWGGIPERYHRLTQRYGWWGLAWLETILRLADFRRSKDEENPETAPRLREGLS